MLRNIKLPKTGKGVNGGKSFATYSVTVVSPPTSEKRFLSLENTCNVFLICFLVS